MVNVNNWRTVQEDENISEYDNNNDNSNNYNTSSRACFKFQVLTRHGNNKTNNNNSGNNHEKKNETKQTDNRRQQHTLTHTLTQKKNTHAEQILQLINRHASIDKYWVSVALCPSSPIDGTTLWHGRSFGLVTEHWPEATGPGAALDNHKALESLLMSLWRN